MAFAGHVGVTLNVDMLVTEGDGITDSRAEHGDSKNWASQVSARRNELTLKALFNEELGVVLQVRTEDRSAVMQVLREHGLSRPQPCRRQNAASRLGHPGWCGRGRRSGATRRAVFKASLQDLHAGVGQRQLEDLPVARQPGLCRRRARRSRCARRSGPACVYTVKSGPRH